MIQSHRITNIGSNNRRELMVGDEGPWEFHVPIPSGLANKKVHPRVPGNRPITDWDRLTTRERGQPHIHSNSNIAAIHYLLVGAL